MRRCCATCARAAFRSGSTRPTRTRATSARGSAAMCCRCSASACRTSTARCCRSARHAARDRAAWDAALDLLPGLDLRREHDGFSVAAAVLSGYDSALERPPDAAARRVGGRLGPARAGRLLPLAARGASGAADRAGRGLGCRDRVRALDGFGLAPPAAAEPLVLHGRRGERPWGRWRLRWSRETRRRRRNGSP